MRPHRCSQRVAPTACEHLDERAPAHRHRAAKSFTCIPYMPMVGPPCERRGAFAARDRCVKSRAGGVNTELTRTLRAPVRLDGSAPAFATLSIRMMPPLLRMTPLKPNLIARRVRQPALTFVNSR